MNPLIQFTTPWLIRCADYAALVESRAEAYERWAADIKLEGKTNQERFDELSERASFYIPQRAKATLDENGIGRLHVLGPVAQGLAPFDKLFMTDLADLRAEAIDLVAKGASAIMVAADTPGGTVHGTPETAATFKSLGVPVGVHVDSLLASAGYYTFASADFISASPSADIGSIGVIIPWVDMSGLWEQFGVKWDPVVSSKADLKGIGGGPQLTKEHRAELQAQVNLAEDDFRAWVNDHRSVDPSAMRGQVQRAPEALDSGLIDYTEDFSAAYDRLLAAVT